MDFKEALNNRYSSILPACAIFNGTDDSLNFGKPAVISGINTSDFYLAVRFRLPANPSTQCLVAGCDINGATTTTRFGIGIGTNGKPFWHLTFGAGLDLSYNYVDSVADGNEHEAVINVDRSGFVQYFMDGVMYYELDISAQVAFNFAPTEPFRVGSFSTVGDAATLFFPGTVQFVSFGRRILTALEVSRLDTIRNTSNSFTIYPNGHSTYEYDLSGNAINGTWEGTGSKKSFFKNGYPYSGIYGYSLYKKSGSADIQIPYSFAGTPISSPSVPAGYSHDSDIPGDSTYLNSASCLIDFDPLNKTHASVDLFKRDNTTIQNATSRASSYYDSANPYRWHVSELLDFGTFNFYFNAAYRNRLFTKVSGVLLQEILNCSSAQSGADLIKAKTYCGMSTAPYPNGDCSSLVATVVSDVRIDATCTIGSTNEDAVSWEYSSNGGTTWSVHGTSAAGVGSYSYTSLSANTNYSFRCRAKLGSLYSAYSNTDTEATYTAEAQLVFNACGTTPSATDKGLINTFVAGLKTDSLWDKLEWMCVYAMPTANASLINWVSPGIRNPSLTGSPAFDAYQGYTGGAGKRIDTGYIPATHTSKLTQNSATAGWYNRTNVAVAGWDFGVIGANNNRFDCDCRNTDDKDYWYTNDTGGGIISSITDSRGFWVQSRTGASTVNTYRNGGSTLQASSRASTGLPNTYSVWNLDINNKGASAGASTRQLSLFFLASGFTQSDSTNFCNRFETLMDAWGTGVI